MAHLGTSAIMDLLLQMVAAPENDQCRTDIALVCVCVCSCVCVILRAIIYNFFLFFVLHPVAERAMYSGETSRLYWKRACIRGNTFELAKILHYIQFKNFSSFDIAKHRGILIPRGVTNLFELVTPLVMNNPLCENMK